ncbi:MAG: SDR family NAD(P)-dependent oxidoreductase [Hespellia sp.]|nr:SDR family NAD(P)-dependent oxidoreductase [Hespellia sp.]
MKIAVITGASSGMGREFAKQIEHFYQNLDEIWIIARRKERLEELQQQLQTKARIITGDLLEQDFYREAKALLEQHHPDIRMLINAAGFGKSGTFLEIHGADETIQSKMIDMNCRSLTQMCALCIPFMSEGSRIINLASAASFCPQTGFAVYAATKSYVLSFSKALNQELKGRRIYVTSVCPGPVKTEFFEVAGGMNSAAKAFFMADPKKVVRLALLDSKKKKTMSVYGMSMKAAHIGGKLLPSQWLLNGMDLLK